MVAVPLVTYHCRSNDLTAEEEPAEGCRSFLNNYSVLTALYLLKSAKSADKWQLTTYLAMFDLSKDAMSSDILLTC